MPLALAVVAIAGIAGCGRFSSRNSADTSAVVHSDSVLLPEEKAALWADSMMHAMSLQLRVGQLFMPAVYSSSDIPTLNLIRDFADRQGVGGIILLKGDVVSAASIADSLSQLAQCPLFIAIDAETGLSMRLADAPSFLWNADISNEADSADLYSYGREIARECRLTGINMVLGPVLDVTPEEGVTMADRRAARISRMRSFGSDPKRVAALGVAYARGLEDGGVISVAKHFPGHGSARTDSHKGLATVDLSAQELWNRDLLPFRRYVRNGLSGVMTGHIYAPSLDSVRRPASVSREISFNLLRHKLGFKGLVLTDAMNMDGAGGYTSLDAIMAGADIIIAPRHTEREISLIVEAVEKGYLSEAVINDRCRRILIYKYLNRLPFTSRRNDTATLRDSLHRDASAACRSLVP